ncbi:hypothetical protein Misp04_45790 [Micromonospora sp. NBRC 101691]|nr:hypothetical protein Misp04_45790 [Micromonospora sp. NBRC 101691]
MTTHGPVLPTGTGTACSRRPGLLTGPAGPTLRAGDLMEVTREASVQFVRPFLFRVIRVLDLVTYDGWVWLDGYQLNAKGDAVARRAIFVQPAGLRRPRTVPVPAPAPRRSTRPATAPARTAHRRL